MDRYRVAVVGAGPSGLYAAAALLASGEPIDVDVLDRLPAPYGLVRYGVAPDHVKMKSVIRVLRQPFEPAHVAFLGGVRIGGPGDPDGFPLDDLRAHVHAVVHATGSSLDRPLGVPGEGPVAEPKPLYLARLLDEVHDASCVQRPEAVVPGQHADGRTDLYRRTWRQDTCPA